MVGLRCRLSHPTVGNQHTVADNGGIQMPDSRRWYVPGRTYFFTVVTRGRRRILCDAVPGRVHEAVEKVRKKRPVEVAAIVLLPITCIRVDAAQTTPIIRYDGSGSRRSLRCAFLAAGGEELPQSESRLRQGERGFGSAVWEHAVRDEEAMKWCVDYVRWNPKKHGYAANVRDWQSRCSSLRGVGGIWAVGRRTTRAGYDEPE